MGFVTHMTARIDRSPPPNPPVVRLMKLNLMSFVTLKTTRHSHDRSFRLMKVETLADEGSIVGFVTLKTVLSADEG